MCAIFGALSPHSDFSDAAREIIEHIMWHSMERGRDGFGWAYSNEYRPDVIEFKVISRDPSRRVRLPVLYDGMGTLIGNCRAEPTTEWVKDKNIEDQQPYTFGDWSIVHNGTIANDKELRNVLTHYPTSIDSAAIVELLHQHTEAGHTPGYAFTKMLSQIKGSYAILATNRRLPGKVFAAANYRPIWFLPTSLGTFFASSAEYFPAGFTPEMMEPYSSWVFTLEGKTKLSGPPEGNKKALIVCSGGLDSTVAASAAMHNGFMIKLLHFRYGSRAQSREAVAVHSVAEALGCEVEFVDLPIYRASDSPLLRPDSKIAGGEKGAEFAHEWVPARNLVMLSVATAIAESGGYGTIVLGNNLEEAGAYPDNEPEFVRKFAQVLPFAVADGKSVKVAMPVGNLMKHEIVNLGAKLKSPMHLTWSCYRAGQIHCGTCGPCFMRRTAFKINNLPDTIKYYCDEV